jgi:hypothetical protein
MAVRSLDLRLSRAERRLKLRPVDLYEDCSYHPVLCLGVNYREDEIWGVSLVDGSIPRSCSLLHCGVKRLTPKQAWQLKRNGPVSSKIRAQFPAERRWWTRSDPRNDWPVRLVSARKKAIRKTVRP